MLSTGMWPAVLEYLEELTIVLKFLTAAIAFASTAALGWRIRRFHRRRNNRF